MNAETVHPTKTVMTPTSAYHFAAARAIACTNWQCVTHSISYSRRHWAPRSPPDDKRYVLFISYLSLIVVYSIYF